MQAVFKCKPHSNVSCSKKYLINFEPRLIIVKVQDFHDFWNCWKIKLLASLAFFKNDHEQHGVQNGSFKIQWLKGLFGLRSQRPSSSFYCSSEQFYLGEIESSWISATAGLCVASVRLWVWFKTVNQVMSMLLRLEECCNLTLEIDAIPQHQTQLHSVWKSP